MQFLFRDVFIPPPGSFHQVFLLQVIFNIVCIIIILLLALLLAGNCHKDNFIIYYKRCKFRLGNHLGCFFIPVSGLIDAFQVSMLFIKQGNKS